MLYLLPLVPDISHALNRIGPGGLRRVGGEHKAVAYRRLAHDSERVHNKWVKLSRRHQRRTAL
jgi:hypothetical protein